MSVYEYRPFLAFCILLSAIFGAVMGSFLNCAAYRIVRGESFLGGRSRCPSCGHPLTVLELIPVVSWLRQKGKCRWCKAKISVRYLLAEAGFAIITVLCLLRFDLTVLCLRNYGFLCCLFLLTLTDLEDMTIPDGCHIAAVLIWAAAQPFLSSAFGTYGDLIAALSAASFWKEALKEAFFALLPGLFYGGGLLALSLIMDRVMGRDTLGGGDIKLFAVTGLYLGWIGTLFAVMLSCVAGLLFHYFSDRDGKGKAFPFGPWIASGAAVILLFGDPLIRWYQGFLS